jgi:hypothetical protein
MDARAHAQALTTKEAQMTTFILILVLNGMPTSQTITGADAAAVCQATGERWKAESKKLRGASQGDFVCVEVKP